MKMTSKHPPGPRMTLNTREAGGPAKRALVRSYCSGVIAAQSLCKSDGNVEWPVSMSTPVTEANRDLPPRGTKRKPTGRMYDAFLGTTRLGLHSRSSSGGKYDLAESMRRRNGSGKLLDKERSPPPQRISDQDSG